MEGCSQGVQNSGNKCGVLCTAHALRTANKAPRGGRAADCGCDQLKRFHSQAPSWRVALKGSKILARKCGVLWCMLEGGGGAGVFLRKGTSGPGLSTSNPHQKSSFVMGCKKRRAGAPDVLFETLIPLIKTTDMRISFCSALQQFPAHPALLRV